MAVLLSTHPFSGFTHSSSQTETATFLNQNSKRNPPDNLSLSKINEGQPIVLRGTVILPNGMIKDGYVTFINNLIVSVSNKPPDIQGAITVKTSGIIFPGFVDVHNHLRFNALPRWNPGRLFTNRYQWRVDPEY